MRPFFLSLAMATLMAVAFSSRGDVIINEFLAENDGGLRDENGDTPDWIELYNNGVSAVSLEGWRLTDNATNVSRWLFPATNIAPGGYLVVFASGKDRATNGAPLHTNFRLENAGGYVALLDSNAVLVSAFTYPGQHRNVSYGPGSGGGATFTLVTNNTPARWLVPADGALGNSWIATSFNDSAWTSNTPPLRYDVGATPMPGVPVLSLDFNDRDNNAGGYLQSGFSSFIIGNVGGNAAVQNGAITRVFGAYSVTLSNSSPSFGYDDRLRLTPAPGSALNQTNLYRDFVFSSDTTGNSGLDITVSGLAANQPYEVSVWSFDSGSTGNRISDWFANGALATNNYTFNGSVLPATDAQYKFSFVATASASGLILVSGRRDSASVANSPAVFLNALQVTSVTSVVLTNGNVASMAGNNSTIYSRQKFLANNVSAVSQMTLRMKYNDGFVAYLNGTEIARRNAPALPAWNSSATATNSSAVAEDIALPAGPAVLTNGTNVLAIHGLNINAGSAEFYLQPQLIATLAPVADGFFTPVTPGATNGPAFYGVVADTKFSVNRGFFDTPFSLSITTATAGAEVRYSLDGSEPSLITGTLHVAPISITGNSFVRAQAFLTGYIPSGVDTHSYIFLRDVLQQSNNIPSYPTVWQAAYPADYAMDPAIVNHPVYGLTISNDLRSIPSLCIVSDQNGLWNQSTGIYPNSTSAGPAWERVTSVELIGGSGATEFATTCKIEMHGNASRDNVRTPKHSMRLTFSSDTGPTRLNYDWFNGGVETHNAIVLRSAGFVDGWAGRYADNALYTNSITGEVFRGLRYRPETTCYLRDVWVKESFRDMGWIVSRTAFVHLYINGLYWGLYQPSERPDESYFAEHLGGDEGAWDVLVGEDNNGPPVIVSGSGVEWTNVLNIVNAGITNEAAYQAVAALVDLDNLIDYMLLHIYAESEDWPRHNWYLARRRATNDLPATKFVCSVWDQELTLDRLVRRDRTNIGGAAGEIYSPARVYQQLRAWPEFRLRFADRVQKHLFNNGALTASNNVARLLGPAAIIRDALVGESARWGDARKTGVPAGQVGTGVTFTRDEWWQPEIDKLATNFLVNLAADNIARLRTAALYPQLGAPAFSQFGGAVSNGFALTISHTNNSGVIYFTTDQTDPRVYGSGVVGATAQAYSAPFLINTPTLVRARVLSGTNWSAIVEAIFYPPQDYSKLALTELMYNPPAFGAIDGDEFEFVELKNTGTNVLNLSGLTFSGIGFTFTNGTQLMPGEFFVLVRNPATFALRYPSVTVNGTYTGALNNGGESIALAHALGGNIFSVNYRDAAPWPVTPDGFGFSLVQVNPVTQAPDDGVKWRASSSTGGSPGADDPIPGTAPIVINEALTHTDLPAVDRIELFNPAATNVNIGGWFLTDDPTTPTKFRIPDGTTINPSGYVVFSEAQFNATPGTNGSFSLSSSGEQVYLFAADASTNLTGYAHGFVFGAAANSVSFGRYVNSVGEEQFPAQISQTFGTVNSGPRVGPMVINEIHYNPGVGGDEFVELKNISAAPVSLFAGTNGWDMNGVGFVFPTNVTVPAGGLVLLVATNPASFISTYSVPAEVLVLGPYSGNLQDSGERIDLRRPDTPDTNGVPRIVVDSVRFNDKAPWPPAADGSGSSLQRIYANQYGDDPINWLAGVPSPGRENNDTDSDGLPNDWETLFGTNPNVADASNDDDGDGQTNAQEYLAGTHPQNASSRLRVESIEANGGGVMFRFNAGSNRTYTVQHKATLEAPAWLLLTNVPSAPNERVIQVTVPPTNSSRFFRVGAP